jgi:quercetin 2,3-dioxygenase
MNRLPGEKRAYFLKAGEGARYRVAGQLATYLARAGDTGGLLEVVVLAGGKGAGFPLHSHRRTREAMVVLEGSVELWLGARKYRMSAGDFANVPPGTAHGYAMQSHRTRILSWTVDGDAGGIYAEAGEPTEGYSYLPGPPAPLEPRQSSLDIAFGADAAIAPGGPAPYVLESGEGERLITGDSLFTFLADQSHTGGSFIALTTQGPKSERIPKHFHEKHTETFLCLQGAMTMWIGDEEVALAPGDFVHAPPGAIHAYRTDAPYTNFMGILAPGLFEPFFRTLCDPYDDYIYPPQPLPVRFDRVIARLPELDLKLVERPGPPR